MATKKTLQGQNIWDLTIKCYGTVEDTKKIVTEFDDIDTDIPAGTEIEVEETNNNIVSLLETNNTDIATYQLLPDVVAPVLFNFRILDLFRDRIYFDTTEPITGTTFANITVSSPTKTITAINVVGGSTTGHYFTVNSDYVHGDVPFISYTGTGSNIEDAAGNELEAFTNLPITNNIIPIFFIYSVTVGASETISLPMFSGDDSLYDFSVNFGDGTGLKSVTAYADTDRQHTYTLAGTYDIAVTGTFDYILFADSPDSIVELKSFGPGGVGAQSFLDCTNFTTISAVDVPTSIHLNSLLECFRNSAIATVNASIDSWDVSAVTTAFNMFMSATSFNQDISGWNTGAVVNMSGMFSGASTFNQDVSPWDVSAVTTMASMFTGASAFNNGGVALDWADTGAVTLMNSMLENASVFNQSIAAWDTSLVTNMSLLFGGAAAFNQAVSTLNTSSATNLSSMFFGATVFNKDVSGWDVSAVTNMNSMFFNASAFNNESLALDWADTGAVTNMSAMFFGATSFNQSLSGWDTTLVTLMSSMFNGASAFNQSVSSFVTTAVTTMNQMFRNATAFNQALSTFNVSAVTNMGSMFLGATAFNQDLSSWSTGAVTDMSSMFQGATAFDQDISSFDVTALTTAANMFLGVTLSTSNYDAILDISTGWPSQVVLSSVSFHAGNSTYTQTSVDSGTTDSTTANKLVDSAQNFLTTVSTNDIAHNTTDSTFAKVSAVDSDTTLSVSNDVFPTGKAYVIQSSNAAKGRFELTDTNGWTITDGGAV